MGDGFKNILLNLILSALTGFDNMVASAQGILTNSGASAFNSNGVWNSVLALSNSLKPFCYIVIAICLLIELAQVASKVDIIKWEHGLKVAVKMVLSKVCIDIAPTFLRACYNQANIWINSAVSAGNYQSLGNMMTQQVQDQLGNVTGLGPILGLFASTMLVALAIKICGLLIQVIAFGRMFELYVYLAVSPLPCAFFPLGDGTGGGISRITSKFFKSFIAVCLQGVMIVLCIRIFYMIIGNAFAGMIADAVANTDAGMVVSDLCYTMLMGAIVLVMSVAKCGSWASKIIDAM